MLYITFSQTFMQFFYTNKKYLKLAKIPLKLCSYTMFELYETLVIYISISYKSNII